MRIGIWSIIKFILAVLLLPAVIDVTRAFQNELTSLQGLAPVFYHGIVAYVIMHLFIFTPVGFFHFWQRIFSDLFRFSAFFAALVPLIIPLLTTIILLLFYILRPALKTHEVDQYVVFIVGFTLAMHVILVAQQVYGEDNNTVKPHYLFTMALVYILNIYLMAVLLDLNFENFSVVRFSKMLWELLRETYLSAYHKLLFLKET